MQTEVKLLVQGHPLVGGEAGIDYPAPKFMLLSNTHSISVTLFVKTHQWTNLNAWLLHTISIQVMHFIT